jgi:hypothetical protein
VQRQPRDWCRSVHQRVPRQQPQRSPGCGVSATSDHAGGRRERGNAGAVTGCGVAAGAAAGLAAATSRLGCEVEAFGTGG